MSTVAAPQVFVPCPVCGTMFAWPPQAPCGRCRADLAGPVAGEYWQLARDEAVLRDRQRQLLTALAEAAHVVTPPAPAQPRSRRRLTDVRAQTILGLVGAALLATAAIVFAAVTWQDLPTMARGGILVAAAATAVATARWLHARDLLVTAGAVGLLADALVATVVWAVHTFDMTGPLVDSGGAALAATAATICAVALAAWGVRWQRWAAGLAWLLAVVFAAVAIATTDGAAVLVPVVAGLVGAGLWFRFAGEVAGSAMATATVAVLGIGVLGTFTVDDGVRVAGLAGMALALAIAATVAGARRRTAVLIGSLPVAVPATITSIALVIAGVVGFVRTVGLVWTSSAATAPGEAVWLAAVPVIVAVALLVIVSGLRPPAVPTVSLIALPLAATAAAWWSGGSTVALTAVAAATLVAGCLRHDHAFGRVLVVAGSAAAVGWLLPWPSLTVAAGATVLLLAVVARWSAIGRQVEQAPVTVIAAALTAAATVVWADATDPGELAGLAAVVAAVAVALAGGLLLLHGTASAMAVVVVGATATVATIMVVDPTTAATVTGALTVGGVVLATAWRHERVTVAVHVLLAAAAASATSWLLLSAAEVDIPEAYTAVPAALALLAGGTWMYRDPTVRSRRAMHPGMLLAVAPTLVMLLGDVQDTGRAVAAAGMAAVLLLVGVVRRIEVPVWYGAAAGLVVTVTQLTVVAGHVPRWTVFATLGAILVASSATFERQRIRARQVQATIRRVADDYR